MSPGAVIERPNLRANGENATPDSYLSARVLMREAAKVCDDLGLTITGGRLRKLIERYIREGRGDVEFRTWFLGYADPTGEAAVRNVLRSSR